jgi:nicotinamide mononucleotide (NMN) deamidase PncC
MFDAALLRQAEELLRLYRAAGKRIATAESCTGGLIAACLTEVAGSSDVVDRGFVTYSNAAKAAMLGVDPALLEPPGPGAVSAEVAAAMAAGALERLAGRRRRLGHRHRRARRRHPGQARRPGVPRPRSARRSGRRLPPLI